MQEKILPGLPIETPLGLLDYEIVFWTTAAGALVVVLGWWLGRKLGKYPGRRQVLAEWLVGWFDSLCRDTLGKRRGRRYLPLFGTLFLFLVVCNMTGLVPVTALTLGLLPEKGVEIGGEEYVDFNGDGAWEPGEPRVDADGRPGWRKPGRRAGVLLPLPVEPTRNVNVPLGLSLLLAFLMYAAALVIRASEGLARSSGKGFVRRAVATVAGGLRGFPGFLVEPHWLMLPLNLVGAAAQVVSVSFRLFGNIFGGAVVMTVVPYVLYELLWPGLDAASNLAVYLIGTLILVMGFGLIQAFVFTMLWIAYHTDLVAEEG